MQWNIILSWHENKYVNGLSMFQKGITVFSYLVFSRMFTFFFLNMVCVQSIMWRKVGFFPQNCHLCICRRMLQIKNNVKKPNLKPNIPKKKSSFLESIKKRNHNSIVLEFTATGRLKIGLKTRQKHSDLWKCCSLQAQKTALQYSLWVRPNHR